MTRAWKRDRLTWVSYAMLAWFAYLQVAPGQVVPHLRAELGFGYAVGGLHVAAFAAGSTVAGLVASRLEIGLGRRRLLWSAVAVLAAGTVGLTVGAVAAATIGSIFVMGLGGGMVLTMLQAMLADHHGDHRTVALVEANVAASASYVLLIGVLALVAAVGADWRAALLASLVVPAVTWWRHRRLEVEAAPPPPAGAARLPGPFWVAGVVLMCCTAAEWCMTSWGATFADDEVGMATDTAVTLMAGYFGGVVAGRMLGSRLARHHEPASLLAVALGVGVLGFVVLWPATTPAQALLGLTLLGLGLGNLYPMALSVAVSLTPGRSGTASGRAVMLTSLSVLLAPLTVGALANASSLKVALAVVPALLVAAAAGLAVVRRTGRPGAGAGPVAVEAAEQRDTC